MGFLSPSLTSILLPVSKQNMGRSIQNFVSLDSHIDSTMKCLLATRRAMTDLHAQADRVQRWYADFPLSNEPFYPFVSDVLT